MNRLENKVAVITGGTAGIGAATALLFAREGAKVTVWGRSEKRGEEFVRSAAGQGLDIAYDKVDTSNFDGVTAGMKKVYDRYGKIDILINNAGITRDSTMKKMTVNDRRAVAGSNQCQPYGSLLLYQGRFRVYACSWLRKDSERFVRRRALRQFRSDQLCCDKGRHHRNDKDPCP